MSDDQLQELRDALRRTIAQVAVRPGSEAATVRTAHRRSWRRRVTAGLAGVAVVTAGVAVVRARAGDDAGRLATSSDPVATQPDVELAFAVPATTAVPAAPGAATPEWTDVAVDAGDHPGAGWAGKVPGVVVAPDPQAPEPGATALYYTADAVTFERLAVDPPSGPPLAWYGDGDTVYAIGAEAGGAVVVDISPDRGQTWTTVPTPVRRDAVATAEHVVTEVNVEPKPVGSAMLVSLQVRPEFDAGGIDLGQPTSGYRLDQQGVTFMVGGCGVSIDGDGDDQPLPCDELPMTWEELGVPPEVVEAMYSARPQLFDVSDGAAREVAPPQGFGGIESLGNGLVRAYAADRDPALFRYLGWGAWEAVDLAPEQSALLEPYWVGDTWVALGTDAGTDEPVLVSDGPAGPATTGLGDLFPDARLLTNGAVTTGSVFAATAQVRDDAFADGPIEVTSGDVTIVRRRDTIDWSVVGADGSPLVGATIEMGAPEGGFSVLDAAGATLEEFDAAAYRTMLEAEPIRTWAILTTDDGVTVGVTDLADVLGVDGHTIDGVDLQVVDDRLVVTVQFLDGSVRVVRSAP